MRVVTSCLTRFWIFDQARELLRRGALRTLIHGTARSRSRQWGIPDNKVRAVPIIGAYLTLCAASVRWRHASVKQRRIHTVHALWSRYLASALPESADVFITLSGFGSPAIRRAASMGQVSVVDHGSLHERVELRLLQEEARRWNLPPVPTWPPGWLIDNEQDEFEAADYVLVLSKAAAATLVSEGVPEHKVMINPPGVNLDNFYPKSSSDGVFRIIQCGGISARKGVQYLLQAFAELRLPNAELWFVGAGLAETQLQDVIARFRGEHVFFKGAIEQRRLVDLYGECSVAVLASIADGFGMVVAQAMACGLPAVVSDNVGAADMVQHGQNGFVVPSGNVDSLKEHLLHLYNNPVKRAAMGKAARNTAIHGYTWADYGDRLLGLLSAMTAGRRTA